MSDDNTGIVNDPRPGQQHADKQDAPGVEEEDVQQHHVAEESRCDDERKKELQEISKLLEGMPPELREEFLATSLEVHMEQRWHGLLPDPESFLKYPEDVQRQMVAWNDAQILDESKRNDRLTDAFISQKKTSQWLNFALNTSFTVAAFISFLITNSALSFSFLAVPGVTIAINVIRNRKDEDD